MIVYFKLVNSNKDLNHILTTEIDHFYAGQYCSGMSGSS